MVRTPHKRLRNRCDLATAIFGTSWATVSPLLRLCQVSLQPRGSVSVNTFRLHGAMLFVIRPRIPDNGHPRCDSLEASEAYGSDRPGTAIKQRLKYKRQHSVASALSSLPSPLVGALVYATLDVRRLAPNSTSPPDRRGESRRLRRPAGSHTSRLCRRYDGASLQPQPSSRCTTSSSPTSATS